MKKQQKIIEINNEKNIKLANERAEYAERREGLAFERYSAKDECAELLRGVTDENRRGDILANRAARLAKIEVRERDCEARHRRKIATILLSAADKIAAAEDDPEPETDTEKDSDVTVKGFQPQQETVYCDGSEHSARIVARRLLNKMPHIPRDGYLNVHVVWDTYVDHQEYFVSVLYGDALRNETEIFSAQRHTAELEAAFMEKARRLFEEEPESGNSHVAEPMARALDAVFGGNPMDNIPTLKRKEGENE